MKKKVFLLLIVSLYLYSCSQSPTEPIRPIITFNFSLMEAQYIKLIIYDQFDMLVITLVNEELGANHHSIVWDCRNEDGQTVASGLYYYTLKGDEYEIIREMIIIK